MKLQKNNGIGTGDLKNNGVLSIGSTPGEKLKIIQNNACIIKRSELYLDSKEDTQSNQIKGGDRKRPERNQQ